MKGILPLLTGLLVIAAGCGRTRDMSERADMTDSMQVKRATQSMKAADSMLDTMPGGEMARGDSTATMRLLKKKIQGR